MHPQVTILIPTFNRSNLLRRAMASVIAQSFKDWQLIISDNASTKETADIVAKVMAKDDRIRYFRHESNVGMLSNWASLITRIDTEYFCILSDDDLLLPEFLEIAVDALNKDSDLGLCFGQTAIIDDQGLHLGYAPTEMEVGRYPAGKGAVAMVRAQHPASTGSLFRTSSFEASGGFDPLAHYVADLDIMLRVAARYPVLFVSEEVAFHVVHAGNSFKDVSSWFPGMATLLRNVAAVDVLTIDDKNEITKSLVVNVLFPLFLQLIHAPVATFNAVNWRCVMECMAAATHPWLMARMLIAYLIQRIGGWAYRRIRRIIFHSTTPPQVITKHQRHPRIDSFLR